VAPPALDQIVKTCLAKDADERWQTAGDIERQLKWIADGRAQAHSQVGVAAPAAARRLPLKTLAVAVAGCVVGAVVADAAIWLATRPAAPVPQRLSIVLPADRPVAFGWGPGHSLAISPDGTHIAYVSPNLDLPPGAPGRNRLQVRSLGGLSVRDLPGTAGARQPFFSPDSQWIGFFTDAGELKKISLAGGNPVTVLEKINGSTWAFGVWDEDDTIIFGAREGLQRVSADGGPPQQVTTLDTEQGESRHTPTVVAGARAVLFSVEFNQLRDPRIDAVRLDHDKHLAPHLDFSR